MKNSKITIGGKVYYEVHIDDYSIDNAPTVFGGIPIDHPETSINIIGLDKEAVKINGRTVVLSPDDYKTLTSGWRQLDHPEYGMITLIVRKGEV